MATPSRLALFGFVGLCLLPSTSLAQFFHGGHSPPPMSATEVANHLRGYYAGNHHHGGYGYAGGAGYGYAGGFGRGYGPTYGGGFFFPGYGNTYGLYPYGPGYNFAPPNYDPPSALTGPYPLSTSHNLDLDPATGLPLLPSASRRAPMSLPLAGSKPSPPPAPITALAQPPVATNVPTNVATIRVVLPEPSAEVRLDGRATTSVGRERTYASPALEAGQYTYSVVATWTQAGVARRETRTAVVSPGETTVLDFTRPETADAAPPAKIDPSLASAPDLKR